MLKHNLLLLHAAHSAVFVIIAWWFSEQMPQQNSFRDEKAITIKDSFNYYMHELEMAITMCQRVPKYPQISFFKSTFHWVVLTL